MTPDDSIYDAGHADGFDEGRREADITGHLLRPHVPHLLDMLSDAAGCTECVRIRLVLEDLLP